MKWSLQVQESRSYNRKTFHQCVSGEGGNQAMFCHQLRRDGRERREACLNRGARQMHAQVRGGVLPLKDWSWTSVDQRDGRIEHHSHRFMKPFSDLAGEGGGAGAQGLNQREIGNMYDETTVLVQGLMIPEGPEDAHQEYRLMSGSGLRLIHSVTV